MDPIHLEDNTAFYLHTVSCLDTIFPMAKFEQMQAFTQVVAAGGFAAAARHMGLSRSAVNKLVIALENDLGTQLLHRSTRVVTPTETGLAFYDRCLEILASVDEAQRSVTQFQVEPKGTLRVNGPMTFGTMYLAPAIADFLMQYPDLRVQLTLNDRFVDPIEEGFDLTVRIAEPQPVSSLLVQPLAPAPRVLCAAPSYLDIHGSPTHPADLSTHSCLHYGQITLENRWTLTGADGDHSVNVRGVLCSNNGEALREAAMRGLGIALLPRFIVESALQQGRLQIILPNYHPSELFIEVLYPVHRHLSTKIRLLIDFLKQRFSAL
jgi:DNA-binding transcriptional LysR family regulator